MMSPVRLLARFLIALLVASITAPIPCLGWESSASDRMECCKRARHDCADQQAADACCAQGEQRQHEQIPAGATTLVAPAAAVVVPFPIVIDAAASAVYTYRLIIDSRPQRPPYLLTSALLI
jgi:hypothetical protein